MSGPAHNQRSKAFYRGFVDGFVLFQWIYGNESLLERTRHRIALHDSSYLSDKGDLERIGRDMRKAFSNIAHES